MVAFLDNNILWWHWLVAGFILLILEMNTGTFIILGLGICAVVVGVVDFLLPMSFMHQLLAWIVLSLFWLWAWKRWVKIEHISDAGQSSYKLDTLGTVTHDIISSSRGKVKFDTPVLGNTAWTAVSKYDIKKNSRVKIIQIEGQLIEVEPA